MANTVAAKTAEYDVTARAGKRVAGRVVEKDKPLLLTEAEAEHGLREGTIVPKGKELPKVFTEGSKALDRMREEAAAVRSRSALLAEEAEVTPAPEPPAPPPGQANSKPVV